MKIALIASINNPTGTPFEGGVAVQVWWTAKMLIARGHDVTLFASGDSDPALNLSPIIGKSLFTNEGFRHADRKDFKSKMMRRLRSFVAANAYKKLSKRLEQDGSFDVIHNHALFDTPLLDAGRYKAPVVTTLHTPPFREIAKGVKVAGAAKTSRFIAVSHALAKDWADYTEAEVIYNGIDLSPWMFQPEALPKTAIWFGRITPQKAPHLAIEAAIRAGYRLDVYGGIVDQGYFETQVQPLIDSSELIHYRGRVSHAELAKAIGRASVMINTPLWEEPFGLTFVEAMACGTPVVTFKSGAAGEIIIPPTGLIVPKGDTYAMAAAMDKAAHLKRADCRTHVEMRFTIDKMIAAYEGVYAEMVGA